MAPDFPTVAQVISQLYPQSGGRPVDGVFVLDPQAIAADTEAKLKTRHSTQPYHLPNCGSVFRNPLPQFAARLIQDAGLKGYQIGNAQVSKLHANFIVNLGNAKASDIFSLIQHIKSVISDRYDVVLETEVKMIGHF